MVHTTGAVHNTTWVVIFKDNNWLMINTHEFHLQVKITSKVK